MFVCSHLFRVAAAPPAARPRVRAACGRGSLRQRSRRPRRSSSRSVKHVPEHTMCETRSRTPHMRWLRTCIAWRHTRAQNRTPHSTACELSTPHTPHIPHREPLSLI
eukprot:3940336-Rhodomonas_salina.4